MTSFNIIRRVIAAASVVSLASGFALPARAADVVEVRSMAVKFADLNLSSPEGAAELYTRIRWAARTACAPSDATPTPFNDACVRRAVADAVIRVNRMELYKVYNLHNKLPLPTTLVSQQR